MYTFCLNYRTKGLHLFPSFWGKSCASQYSIFFFFFRLAHLLLNFLVKRCAPFGQNIKQKVYTLWSKKCTPFASIFYRKVYTFCPIMLSFTTWECTHPGKVCLRGGRGDHEGNVFIHWCWQRDQQASLWWRLGF